MNEYITHRNDLAFVAVAVRVYTHQSDASSTANTMEARQLEHAQGEYKDKGFFFFFFASDIQFVWVVFY